MKKLSLLKRVTVPGLLLLALARPGVGQTLPPIRPNAPLLNSDTTQTEIGLPPDSLVIATPAPVDSVRLAWLRLPPALRDLLADRVACFETDVPHTFNNSVLAYITFFTQRNRAYTQRVLERENMYFPLFEKYLAKYNLPADLKYLAVVESALIPTAKSRVGATGLWQFMGPTASDWRLLRDDWVDERMSPDKATEAACKYLRALYGVFHDWELVLASYNWGVGNVQRVMRRTGKNNFWDLYPYMPAETRNYVPTFTAIMYTMKYAHAHQLHSPELRYQYAEPLDTLHLRGRAFDLRRLSQAVDLPDSLTLLRYNPEIKRAYLPAGYRAYVIQVPVAVRAQLATVDRATLFAYCQPANELPVPLLPLPPRLAGFTAYSPALATNRATAAPTTRSQRKTHIVKSGQTVASLASQYGVSQSQLRSWNKLSRTQLVRPAQRLTVLVPVPTTPAADIAAQRLPAPAVVALRSPNPPGNTTASAPVGARVATLPAPTPELPIPSTTLSRRSETTSRSARNITLPSEAAPTPDTTMTAYVVRRGDSLDKLARLRNTTVAQLMEQNQLESKALMPGQKLLVPLLDAAEPEVATTAVISKPARTVAPTPKPLLPTRTHLVQPGDTLYNISRRYQGITVERLRQLNHLKSDEVKPGQKLIVQG